MSVEPNLIGSSPDGGHTNLNRNRRQVGKQRRNKGSAGRGRGSGGRRITGNRRRGRGGGITNYALNERVLALWSDEKKFYRATISSIHWDGTYGVVFDSEKDREYNNQQEDQIQPVRNYTYHDGQQVKGLFVKENKWYDATILRSETLGRYAIKFGHLTKEFVQRSEFLRPCLDNGDRVMALWFKDNKYLPATIEEDEKHTYSIRFDGRKNSFKGQRPDTVYRLEEFEVDDEVLALWGQDGFFYPAVVTSVEGYELHGDDENEEMTEVNTVTATKYRIRFHGLGKEFRARAYNLKKRFPEQ